MSDRVLQAIGALLIACALLGMTLLAGTAPVAHPMVITAWGTQPVPAR